LLGIGLTGKVEGGVTGGVVRYGGRLAATGEAGQEVGGVSVGGMGVEVAFEGDAEGMGRLEAAVRKDGWEGSYEGVVRYADLGVTGAVKVQHGTDGGVVRVDGGKGSYAISGDSLTFGTAELRDMNIRALLNGKSFDFSIDGRLWNGVSGAPLHAEIHSGSYEGFEGADFGIDLKEIDLATAFSLAKAFGVEGLPALPAGSILSANIFGQTDMKRLSWSAPEIALRIPLNGAEARIEASLAGNLSEARVKNLKIAYGGQEATLQGTATYGETVGFKGSLGFGGEQYALSVDYAEGMLNLTGDYGLFAQVAALENGGYGLTLEAEGLPVKVGTGRLVAGLKATGEYRSGTDWALHLAGVSARYEGSGTPLPELSGIAELSPGKAVFSRLALKGPGYGLTGPVVVGYGSGEGGDFLTIAGQFLKDDNEREKYQFDLRYSAGMVSGGAKVAGLPVERFQGVPVKGDLEADIAVEGAFDFATLDLGHLPAIRFTARLANGEYKSMPITASTSGSIDKGILTLENFAATYLGHSFENIGAEVSLTDRKASVHGTYKTVFGGERVSADLKVELACLGESDLVPFEFQGTLESLRISETILKDWGFSGGYSEEGLQFRGGEDSVVLVYRKDGEFDLSLAAPFPIKARAAGTLAGGNIDAAIAAIDFDLSQIGSLFSTGAIIVKKGRLGGDITMKGPIADPEINGSLIIKDAKIDIDQFVKVSAGPFDIPLVFSGKSVELGPNLMPFGGGSLDVSASAGLDHWKLLDISVAASSRASSTIDIDGSILGITVAGGKARVALDMAVEDGFLDIGGSLLLEKGEVMVGAGDANAAPANEESGAGEFRIRADIGFGRQVQFYLPSKDLPLVNGSADPSSALTLKFDSGSGALALDGTLSIKSGYILYYLRNFFIKRGEVRFAETEEKFDPRIDVTAELRESNEEGPVIITLETDNAPLSNLNPRLTSTPPMAQSQLLALLGGGILSTTSASGSLDVREAVIGSSEFIPQFNVFKAFESRVREALGVDMIYLRSTFLQRWLLDISKPAGSPDPEDPLASYLANTELYVGKYLSDSAFIHASVRLEEDPLVAASHLRLDSEVGIEFDSPWGMLTYSLSPSIGDAALVAGQALSLSWRISY
ncbi:MAG: translocation/assembly module TamB domain-containing protein, partial [Rectinemataceae bacterium]